jgi:O-antigen/teichoic acid export membrane protein
MLAIFFTPVAAGYYTLGNKILGLPSRLISKSVYNVFYPRITEATRNKENLTKLILKVTFSLAGIGIFPFAIIFLVGPVMFGFVFGEEWVVAGEYSRWLALWFFTGFINSPSVAAIVTLSIQRWFLGYEIVSIFLRFISIYIGFYFFKDDVIAVALFSLTGAVLNLFLIIFTIKKSADFRR